MIVAQLRGIEFFFSVVEKSFVPKLSLISMSFILGEVGIYLGYLDKFDYNNNCLNNEAEVQSRLDAIHVEGVEDENV